LFTALNDKYVCLPFTVEPKANFIHALNTLHCFYAVLEDANKIHPTDFTPSQLQGR